MPLRPEASRSVQLVFELAGLALSSVSENLTCQVLSVLEEGACGFVACRECFSYDACLPQCFSVLLEGLLCQLGSLTQSLGPSGFQSRVWPWLSPAFVALVLLQSSASVCWFGVRCTCRVAIVFDAACFLACLCWFAFCCSVLEFVSV